MVDLPARKLHTRTQTNTHTRTFTHAHAHSDLRICIYRQKERIIINRSLYPSHCALGCHLPAYRPALRGSCANVPLNVCVRYHIKFPRYLLLVLIHQISSRSPFHNSNLKSYCCLVFILILIVCCVLCSVYCAVYCVLCTVY